METLNSCESLSREFGFRWARRIGIPTDCRNHLEIRKSEIPGNRRLPMQLGIAGCLDVLPMQILWNGCLFRNDISISNDDWELQM